MLSFECRHGEVEWRGGGAVEQVSERERHECSMLTCELFLVRRWASMEIDSRSAMQVLLAGVLRSRSRITVASTVPEVGAAALMATQVG